MVLERIKIYADGADLNSVEELIKTYRVSGFTTNPTLMRALGVVDYESFARELIERVKDLPISFEVFDDEAEGMRRQARIINGWGRNVYVKIPITNTRGMLMRDLIKELGEEGIKVNTTAVFTKEQINELENCFNYGTPAVVSVFAGRIADAGQDPIKYVHHAVEKFRRRSNVEILWASPREIYNVIQAAEVGAHIITVPPSLIPKIKSIGKDLADFSLETVQMFRDDAVKSGYIL